MIIPPSQHAWETLPWPGVGRKLNLGDINHSRIICSDLISMGVIIVDKETREIGLLIFLENTTRYLTEASVVVRH